MSNIWDRERLLRSTILAGFAASGLAMSPVYAQEAEQVPDQAEEEDDSDDTIVVTGSRLRRNEFTSVSPLQVVDGETARDLGLVDASEILTNTSVASGQQNTVVSSTGLALQQAFTTVGSQTPSLRGLGSSVTGRARNLILINGRRYGPVGIGGAPANPDTSMIPGSLVARTEVLLDGASSVYGSDAVAGVINYIMRTDFDGVEATVSTRQTEYGAGQNDFLSLATGISNDRGYMNFALEYQQTAEITKYDVYNDILGLMTTGTDGNEYACSLAIGEFDDGRQVSICSDTPAGFTITGFGHFVPNHGTNTPGVNYSLVPGRSDFVYRSGSYFLPQEDPDINGFPQNYDDTFVPDSRRLTMFTSGEYDMDFGDNTSFFFEAMYSERELKSQGSGQYVLPYGASNPFNPDPRSGGLIVGLQRIDTDQTLNVSRFVGGFRGDLPQIDFMGLSNWGYEIFGSVHRSNGVQSVYGFLHEDRVVQALANSLRSIRQRVRQPVRRMLATASSASTRSVPRSRVSR